MTYTTYFTPSLILPLVALQAGKRHQDGDEDLKETSEEETDEAEGDEEDEENGDESESLDFTDMPGDSKPFDNEKDWQEQGETGNGDLEQLL